MALAKPLDGWVAGFVHSSSMNAIADFDPRGLRSRHLIVLHTQDACRVTSPSSAGVPSEIRHGTDRDERRHIDQQQCEGLAHHGYNGIEQATVDRIKAWIARPWGWGRATPVARHGARTSSGRGGPGLRKSASSTERAGWRAPALDAGRRLDHRFVAVDGGHANPAARHHVRASDSPAARRRRGGLAGQDRRVEHDRAADEAVATGVEVGVDGPARLHPLQGRSQQDRGGNGDDREHEELQLERQVRHDQQDGAGRQRADADEHEDDAGQQHLEHEQDRGERPPVPGR